MKSARNLIFFAISLMLLAGCATASSDDKETSDSVDAPASTDETTEETTSEVCALNRAHLHYRQQQTENFPILVEELLKVLRKPANPEERVAMLRRDWNADWDPHRITQFVVEATPYGPRLAGRADTVDDVAELSIRINQAEHWPPLLIREIDGEVGDGVYFSLVPLVRPEPSPDDSCDFVAAEPSPSLDHWETSDLSPWASHDWSQDRSLSRSAIVDHLRGLDDELGSVDSAYLSWNGDRFRISLSLYDRDHLAETVARFPVRQSDSSFDLGGLVEDIEDQWAPADDWLDPFKADQKIEENRESLEEFAETYREVAVLRRQTALTRAIGADQAARANTFHCLFWAFVGNSGDLDPMHMVEARDNWRDRVDDDEPHLELASIELMDGDMLSWTVSSKNDSELDRFESEFTACYEGSQPQWEREFANENNLSSASLSLLDDGPESPEHPEGPVYTTPAQMLDGYFQHRVDHLDALNEDSRQLARERQLTREAIPLEAEYEVIHTRLANTFVSTGLNLDRSRSSTLGCTTSDSGIELSAMAVEVEGQADAASLLMTLYFVTRHTRIASPIELNIGPPQGRFLNVETTFAHFHFDSLNAVCNH